MRRITDNVYVGDNFRSCNSSFVVTGAGVVLIDTPMVPAEAKKWAGEIARHGELRYIINTEPHNDHVAGDGWFGGTLVAHEGTRRAILKIKTADFEHQLQWMAPDSLPLPAGFRFRPPEIVLSQRLTIYLGGHTFQLIHLPGHTLYEVAVYVPEEKTLFTGDNVVQGMPIFFQAVPFKWLDSLETLKKLDIENIVPGHGGVGGKDQLQVMQDNIKYCIEAVKAAIGKGWSLEETQQKLTFADRFSPVGPVGPDDRIAMMRRTGIARLYEVLKK
jgi:cyclase